MLKRILLSAFLVFFAVAFNSCGKEDPPVIIEEELITTLKYTLSPSSEAAAVVLIFEDLDGEEGMEATITGGTLAANQTYTGTIQLLNESETPVEDITVEIMAEDDAHQFFFQSSISDLSVSYTDEDDNGNPVGLGSTLTTGEAASGTLKVILRHTPIKDATGVSDGDISNAGGETDIEVIFPIDVQ